MLSTHLLPKGFPEADDTPERMGEPLYDVPPAEVPGPRECGSGDRAGVATACPELLAVRKLQPG